ALESSLKASPNTEVTAPLEITKMTEVSPEEIRRRQEYLRQQREKLVALKKQEREKLLQKYEESSSSRPRSARAAQRAVQEDAANPAPDANVQAFRNSLAAMLKAEVIDKNFLSKLRQETFPLSREEHFILIRSHDVKSQEEISGNYFAPFPTENWNPRPMHVQTNNLTRTTVPQFQNAHTSGIIKNDYGYANGQINKPPTQGNPHNDLVKQMNGNSGKLPYSKNISIKNKSVRTAPVCRFCLQNNERPECYSKHKLKDKNGIVTCPVLRKYVCDICGATGDTAHTLSYCPYNTNNKKMPLTLILKQTNVDSVGRPKNYADFINDTNMANHFVVY
ncbi:nanos-type domain-containing protein, partial [Trichonephila clavata]